MGERKIALVGVAISAVALIASLIVPEVRCFLGLETCPSNQVINKNTPSQPTKSKPSGCLDDSLVTQSLGIKIGVYNETSLKTDNEVSILIINRLKKYKIKSSVISLKNFLKIQKLFNGDISELKAENLPLIIGQISYKIKPSKEISTSSEVRDLNTYSSQVTLRLRIISPTEKKLIGGCEFSSVGIGINETDALSEGINKIIDKI